MLYLIAGLLVALALAFVVWPLLRTQAAPKSVASRRALMRALYRDRVAELEREAAAGQLDPETRSQVVEELGANLLDEFQQARAQAEADAEAAAERREIGRRRAGAAVWLVAVLLPAAGTGVYLSAGEPDAVEVAGAEQVLRLDPARERAELEDWRDRLTRRVARRPEDAQSWYLLGISRLQLGEFAAAADAFASARQRMEGHPNVDVYWLQARYLAAGGSLDQRSREIAEGILEARPDHPLVLEMFAIDAYRSGDFRAAVAYLNRALNNELSPSQRQALMQGLAQARSRMEPLEPTIDVAISAPDGLPRDATVFVLARPPGGGMPLAVVRRPAAMLPAEIRLDDTVSMAEGLELSDAERLEVVVRVSRSGNAMAGPGDWEWRSGPLDIAGSSGPLRLEARPAPLAAASSPGPGAAAGPVVDVRIPAPDGAPDDGVLFVLARPPGGGMPYAVIRRDAGELPLTVRLDDSASMTGARRLSDAERFEVVVRLSVSGNAMAGPGDWEWRSGVVEGGAGDGPRRLQAELAPRNPG